MVLTWSATIWGKHIFLQMAIARRLQCYRLSQFSGTELGSENCKYGICALSCAPPRFGLLLSCHRFVQYVVRNCKSTSMQLWKCLTVSPLRSACLAMHQTQGRNEVRWRPGQETSLVPPCSNTRTFGSKIAVEKSTWDMVVTFRRSPVIRRPGKCAPLIPALRLWSDYNEEKTSTVATHIQSKEVVEWGNSES